MHEEQSRLLAGQMIVKRRNLDAVPPQLGEHGRYFRSDQHEVARSDGSAHCRGLEVDRRREAERRWNGHSILRDLLGAREGKLVGPAGRLSLASHDPVESLGIKRDCRWGRRRLRARRCSARRQSLAQCGRQFYRVAVAVNVHIHRRGSRPEKVVVEGCNREAAFQ
jgi:hypothetical protein